MRSKWLITSNFERMQDLISAVNTVSIHAKLRMAGIEDPTDAPKLQRAKAILLALVDRFQELIDDVERSQSRTVIGADPQLGDLVMRYLDQKRHLPEGSPQFAISFDRLRELIQTENMENLLEFISCLKQLRTLLEQHAYVDVVDLIGEM